MHGDVVPGDCRGEYFVDHTAAEDHGAPDRVPSDTDGTSADARSWSPAAARFASLSLEEIAASAGLRTIHVVAWRDYTDPEAGGSELHAHRILSAWSRAGIDIAMTTSSVQDAPAFMARDGYQITRRVGRYSIFPRTMLSGLVGHLGRADGLVEIWNGMPFLSPVWARCPSVVFLHHVHAEMWKMVLPRGLAEVGYEFEHRIAPPFYRRSRIITLSSSSRDEIVEQLRLPASNISICPPGVEHNFTPGSHRSPTPLVIAVGRLVPVKRFELLIEAAVRLKPIHPDLRLVIAGEGYERAALENQIRRDGAEQWISLPGFVDDKELLELYRSTWLVASSSLREGWGMTVTEAGACGTPAVASRISGHMDAVRDGSTGLLFDDVDGMVAALDAVLSDGELRTRLGAAALTYASGFSWEATARQTLAELAGEKVRRG
jgi:glycosyltransferase involved in cell wall biosynthesis